MCTSTAFILETGKELDGAYERELIAAHDFQECSNYCLNSLEERGFLCRSFIFDDGGRTCILYDEDPLFYGEIGQDPRQMNQLNKRPLKSSAGNLYRVLCVNTERGDWLICFSYADSFRTHTYGPFFFSISRVRQKHSTQWTIPTESIIFVI